MVKALKHRVKIVTVIALLLPSLSMAQIPAEEAPAPGPRSQLATIIFAGLGGAVLGLSTLSFYGRPQDRLSNIAVGFALGVIGGFIYTTYRAATKPYQNYQALPPGVFHELDLMNPQFERGIPQTPEYPLAQLSWEF